MRQDDELYYFLDIIRNAMERRLLSTNLEEAQRALKNNAWLQAQSTCGQLVQRSQQSRCSLSWSLTFITAHSKITVNAF
jgi:hypothetical protein